MIGARLLSSAYAEIRWETGLVDWIIVMYKTKQKKPPTRVFCTMYMYVHVVVHAIQYIYSIGSYVNLLVSFAYPSSQTIIEVCIPYI